MGINLLIIESDRFFRQNLLQRLGTDPFRIFESDGTAGLKKVIRTNKIDVVLLSLGGMKEEGLALLRRIKRLFPAVEVILLNGAAQLSLSIEGMKLGAFDDFFVPFDVGKLVGRIKEAHQRKASREGAKRSIFKRYQDAMVAAAFAEAGETEAALAFIEEPPPGAAGAGGRTTRLTGDQKGEKNGQG